MALRNGLVSRWSLDESSGTRTDDVSGNNLDEINSSVPNVSGKLGSGADFTGFSDPDSSGLKVTGANGINAGSGDFTVAFWVYIPTGAGGQFAVVKGDPNGQIDWEIRLAGGADALVWTTNGNATASYSSSISNDAWHLVILRRDSANHQYKIRVDNTDGGTTASLTGDQIDDVNDLYVGTDGVTHPFGGYIDELVYWNRLLTGTELSALWNSGSGVEGPYYSYSLNFTVNPSNAVGNVAISPAIAVEILDETSTRDTSASDDITLAIGTNPGGGALSGTNPVSASSGVASFSDMSINNAGVGYTLTASRSGFTGDTSSTFNITAPASGPVGGIKATHGVLGSGVF